MTSKPKMEDGYTAQPSRRVLGIPPGRRYKRKPGRSAMTLPVGKRPRTVPEPPPASHPRRHRSVSASRRRRGPCACNDLLSSGRDAPAQLRLRALGPPASGSNVLAQPVARPSCLASRRRGEVAGRRGRNRGLRSERGTPVSVGRKGVLGTLRRLAYWRSPRTNKDSSADLLRRTGGFVILSRGRRIDCESSLRRKCRLVVSRLH